jgi:hypothetical protein
LLFERQKNGRLNFERQRSVADQDVVIFASYAHDDDLSASEGEVGFVTFLHRRLELKLRELGLKLADKGVPGPKIWRDLRRINVGDQFNGEIDDGLKNAQILIVFLSNNWIERPYCRKELDEFVELRRASGIENVAERLIVISKEFVDRLKRPPVLQNQAGFPFYAREDQSDVAPFKPFFNRGAVCDPRFYDRLDDLALSLQKRVERIATGGVAPAAEPLFSPNGRTIYLAKPAPDMKAAYIRVASTLQENGYKVVPEVGSEVPENASALFYVDDALAQAEASVHLIGEKRGFALDADDPLDPIAKLQLTRARKRAAQSVGKGEPPFRRIVWAPKILNEADPERDPVKVLERFDTQISTDKISGDILTEFSDFLFQYLASTATTAGRLEEQQEKTPATRRWYVSYAWADQDDPTREMKVDELCNDAKKRGVEIIRDKTTLARGDLISEFMRRLGDGDRVFIFLSDKYLHSPYGVFELFEMWRNSGENKSEFLRRVRFFTIDGTKIGEPDEWLIYTAYWQQKREKLREAINRVGWEDAGEEAIKRFWLMDKFTGKISDVLALFADVVQPRTFEDFLSYGFGELPRSASDR